MLDVYICVGSTCHLNGSHFIIKTFQRLIKNHNLEDRIELKASFCLGNCTNGVAIKVGEELAGGITPANAEEKFKELVIKKL